MSLNMIVTVPSGAACFFRSGCSDWTAERRRRWKCRCRSIELMPCAPIFKPRQTSTSALHAQRLRRIDRFRQQPERLLPVAGRVSRQQHLGVAAPRPDDRPAPHCSRVHLQRRVRTRAPRRPSAPSSPAAGAVTPQRPVAVDQRADDDAPSAVRSDHVVENCARALSSRQRRPRREAPWRSASCRRGASRRSRPGPGSSKIGPASSSSPISVQLKASVGLGRDRRELGDRPLIRAHSSPARPCSRRMSHESARSTCHGVGGFVGRGPSRRPASPTLRFFHAPGYDRLHRRGAFRHQRSPGSRSSWASGVKRSICSYRGRDIRRESS